MKEVKRVKFDDIKPFINQAKKERVSFENPTGSEWYAIFDDGKIVSFFCLVIGKKSARFKSNYTVSEYRRKGCLQLFISIAKRRCLEKGIHQMTAFCTPLSIKSHLRNGAKEKSRSRDITFVKYDF